jgi:large subunit ribosomal protein L29
MTKPSDIRAKSEDQLNDMLLTLRRDQFNLRFRRASGETAGAGQIRATRRDIARIKTILAEKTSSAAPAGKE